MMNNFYKTCSDENILVLISEQDDEQAFEELYNRYFKILFNYTFSKVSDRFNAQEIVQELFVSVWQQRNREPVISCKSFLFTIAKRLIISFYRKEYTRQHHYGQWEIRQTGATDPADQPTLASDLQSRYEEGLHLLSPKCQEVFVLSRQGFSNKQIGEQLAIAEKTVEQHITKALRILKEHLKEHIICALLLFPLY
jgi:RNA polymerase sigma-70 factor (family 1)